MDPSAGISSGSAGSVTGPGSAGPGLVTCGQPGKNNKRYMLRDKRKSGPKIRHFPALALFPPFLVRTIALPIVLLLLIIFHLL
jgi:hypothetical protein